MADRLKERVALVTGAATGIGRATIDRLTSEGAIVIAGIADDSQRHDMASFEAVMLDVRSEADWGRAVAHVEQQHGGLDILVNNAGIHRLATALETTQMVWDEVMSVNLWGSFLGCKTVIPAMQRRGGGAIVNLCSINAITGVAGSIAYSKSKGWGADHDNGACHRACQRPNTGQLRLSWAAHSDEIGRRFRSKPATHSDRSRPVIPTKPARVADRTASG